MIKGRKGLNFLLLSLHFFLLFNSSVIEILFQALLGLWKAQSTVPTRRQFPLCLSYASNQIQAEIPPAAQHPKSEKSRKMFLKDQFSQTQANLKKILKRCKEIHKMSRALQQGATHGSKSLNYSK